MLRLLCFLLILAVISDEAVGQTPDTASYPYRYYNFSLGTLVTADGRSRQWYLPYDGLSFTGLVPYFAQQPLRHKDRLQKFIAVRAVHSITVRRTYYEIVRKDGQPTKRLAVRMLEGPVPLFLWMKTGGGNYSWYLRGGPGTLVEVKPATFRAQVVPLLAGQPALADSMQRNFKGYRYADLCLVLRRYNARAAPAPAR